ncbi:hypothetical protein [Facklamia sp. 7083-14-GEN3]|uniref:hypothetical protein n=1 Tax=Facklamia sp. 7083-14-GEN3 TaxID=2973478 RepID=UPI00215BE384|nr:hypothetical protein [Facklamia sp. 7083-14-GEN3]MCR8969147.1 hypothetical protein [Facklamia sp. 7083-14-GEN3]
MGLFSRKKKKHDDYQDYLNYEQEEKNRLRHQSSSFEQENSSDQSIYQENKTLYREFINRAEAIDDSQAFPNYSEEASSQLDSQNEFDINNELSIEEDGAYNAFNNQFDYPDQGNSIKDYQYQALDEGNTPIRKRAKYSAKMDRFLNNGIIIVGFLLVLVLLIAFLA